MSFDDEDEALALTDQTEEATGWADLSLYVSDDAGEEAKRLNHLLLAHIAHTTLDIAGIQRPVERAA